MRKFIDNRRDKLSLPWDRPRKNIPRARKLLKEDGMREFIGKILKIHPSKLPIITKKRVSGLYSQALIKAKFDTKKKIG